MKLFKLGVPPLSQAPAAVAALLARLGLEPDALVRVEVAGAAPGGAAAEVRAAGCFVRDRAVVSLAVGGREQVLVGRFLPNLDAVRHPALALQALSATQTQGRQPPGNATRYRWRVSTVLSVH